MKTKRNLSASIPNETRKAVYARDGYRCALCDDTHGLQIHHIVHRSCGGNDTPCNLITLCWRCHAEAHGTWVAERHAVRPPRTAEERYAAYRMLQDEYEQLCVEYVSDYYAERNNEKEVVFGVGIVFGLSLVIVKLRRIADLIFTAAVTNIITEHLPLLGHIFNAVGVKIFFFAIHINIKKVRLGVHTEHRSRSFHEEKIFIELMKKEYCGYDCEGKTDIKKNSLYVYVFHSYHPFHKVNGESGSLPLPPHITGNHFFKFGIRNAELK